MSQIEKHAEGEKDTRKILLIATTRLCKDGLTEIFLRIAKTLREDEIGIALAEGCAPSMEAELQKWGRLYFLPFPKKLCPVISCL